MLFIYWIKIQITKTNIVLSNILCKKKRKKRIMFYFLDILFCVLQIYFLQQWFGILS